METKTFAEKSKKGEDFKLLATKDYLANQQDNHYKTMKKGGSKSGFYQSRELLMENTADALNNQDYA